MVVPSMFLRRGARSVSKHVANYMPVEKSVIGKTKKEKFLDIQRRKHKPQLPASLRLRKRILVIEDIEDVPEQIKLLKEAMYSG
jgi:hypothetical protein